MLAEMDRRRLHETGAATTHTPRGQSVAASGGSARMSSEADGVPSASFDGSAATHLNCSKAPVSVVPRSQLSTLADINLDDLFDATGLSYRRRGCRR
jgi:hypothetical protein